MNEGKSILLIEDDRNERDVALRALDRAGLGASVDIARDGQEALETLGLEPPTPSAEAPSGAPARPRVIFLDLKMPRVDGWEVLQRIRTSPQTACIPVVVLSSSDRELDVRRSYELGANSFVLKHYDARGPGTYIADAARYWLDLNQPPPGRSIV